MANRSGSQITFIENPVDNKQTIHLSAGVANVVWGERDRQNRRCAAPKTPKFRASRSCLSVPDPTEAIRASVMMQKWGMPSHMPCTRPVLVLWLLHHVANATGVLLILMLAHTYSWAHHRRA